MRIYDKKRRQRGSEGEMGRTYEQLLDEIFSILVEALGKGIIQFLDLLPSEVFRRAMEREAAGNHLVNDAAEGPQIGAV